MRTICQLLTLLYKTGNQNQRNIIEDCFVMAKKMNVRLSELNNIPVSEKETEENWLTELRNSASTI